jgi:hypothetical protein
MFLWVNINFIFYLQGKPFFNGGMAAISQEQPSISTTSGLIADG